MVWSKKVRRYYSPGCNKTDADVMASGHSILYSILHGLSVRIWLQFVVAAVLCRGWLVTVWPIWVKTTEVKHQTLPSLARSEQLSSSAEGDCKHLSSQPGWCINIRTRAHSLIIIIQLEEDLEHLRSCAQSWSRLYSVTKSCWCGIWEFCQAPPRSLIYPIHQTHLQITIKPRSV